MSTLCFTFLATDFCSSLTMLFFSLSKMGKICRGYANGENVIPMLSQCSLPLIGYIFLSITHLMSRPFWQQQVKILFAYNYNKLCVFYYKTVGSVQLIWLDKRCSMISDIGTFHCLYHSTCLCLWHKIPILAIICYIKIIIPLLQNANQSVHWYGNTRNTLSS